MNNTHSKTSMRVERNEAGRWEVAFYWPATGTYCFEADSPSFATKAEAEQQMRQWAAEDAAGRAADARYQSQIAYACGERD